MVVACGAGVAGIVKRLLCPPIDPADSNRSIWRTQDGVWGISFRHPSRACRHHYDVLKALVDQYPQFAPRLDELRTKMDVKEDLAPPEI
ncbi:MAG: hypothetical protein C4523_14230 [Myxococcales bacterium]|nr:MAG: hypothetical protein C4523_14230 [Myxococcales bacterium]